VKVGDLVMASEAYSTTGSCGRVKGIVARFLESRQTDGRSRRVEIILNATGSRCSFRTEELEVVSESR